MSPRSFIRRLVWGLESNRPAPQAARFVPQLTPLECRTVPSGSQHVPSNEMLTLLGASETGVVKHESETTGTVTVTFKLTGGGPAPDGLPLFPGGTGEHTSTGTATHLGKHTGSGVFVLGSLNISPTGAVTGTFSGSYTFVAANGDLLVMTYGAGFTGVLTGQLSADGTLVQNVVFDAVFTPDPVASTGRFAVANGGFRMIATADSISLVSSVPGFTAPFNYTWVGDGELVLKKGKK